MLGPCSDRNTWTMCSVLAARPVGGGGFILCPWRVTGVERAGDGRCERGKPTGWMGPQPPTCRVVNPAWQSCRRKGFLGSGLPCCPEHHGRRVPPLDLMLRTALHHGPGLLWLCALQGSWTHPLKARPLDFIHALLCISALCCMLHCSFPRSSDCVDFRACLFAPSAMSCCAVSCRCAAFCVFAALFCVFCAA